MTGYGWGDAVQDRCKITVELSSVNRKQSEISINLPRELEVLEAQIRDAINHRVARGRVTARVTLHAGEKSNGGSVRINTKLAAAYAKKFRTLARELTNIMEGKGIGTGGDFLVGILGELKRIFLEEWHYFPVDKCIFYRYQKTFD